jgi:hypothetical protein
MVGSTYCHCGGRTCCVPGYQFSVSAIGQHGDINRPGGNRQGSVASYVARVSGVSNFRGIGCHAGVIAYFRVEITDLRCGD